MWSSKKHVLLPASLTIGLVEIKLEKERMEISFKTVALVVIGAVSYSVWAYMAYYDASLRADFLNANKLMVAGTIGLVLRDLQPAIPKDKP